MSRFIRDYVAKAQELSVRGETFVTVTLVKPEGHVPQDIGAKAIVTASGLAFGTVGGGRLEARAVAHAQEMIGRATSSESKQSTDAELVRYDLQQEFNMVCGGAATLFYELATNQRWNIAVFGAGHVAQAVVPLVSTFECNLWCIDPRLPWLDKIPEKSNLQKMHSLDLPSEVSKLPTGTFYLCVTQGHATDLPVVREILKRGDAGFIGVIGSVPKARTMRAALIQEGFSEGAAAGIHCPVGLSIGTNAPNEIAVSIAAQLLQIRDQIGQQAG